jgi:uncharacterized secreted protein with C-terminal beta-propeller domain
MEIKYTKLSVAVVSATLFLSACGGNDGASKDIVIRSQLEMNAADVSSPSLNENTTISSLETHLKNGLYTASIRPDWVQARECNNCSAPTDDFSQTNVQESGVDELNRIQYDGDYLYVAAHFQFEPLADRTDADLPPRDHIKIMKKQAGSPINKVHSLTLPGKMRFVSGLYFDQNKLTAIGEHTRFNYSENEEEWHISEREVDIAIYDVQSPEYASVTQHLSFNGSLISSRRIDNKLYLVSVHRPSIEGVDRSSTSNGQKQKNYERIQAADINDLMPKLTLADNSVHNLVDSNTCFIPQDADELDGYDKLITLTTIDLNETNFNQPDAIQSVCINAAADLIYASSQAVYVASDDAEQSRIHKFLMTDALAYAGTGVVSGHISARHPGFRLSEYQNTLRVLATRRLDNEPEHTLYIFDTEPQGKTLNVISQLPNNQHPEPIGNPGEDVFAVRYFDDKAYIVTFGQIDPLHVLDLSDTANPRQAGEIELPGHFVYLHPINKNLLLGVGQEPHEELGSASKVSLIDVSDSANPVELSKVLYPATHTPLDGTVKQITVLKVDENHTRIAMPIHFWKGADDGTSLSKLQLLEVITTSSGAELVDHNAIVADYDKSKYNFIHVWEDRAVIDGDRVYYVHGNEVYGRLWMN